MKRGLALAVLMLACTVWAAPAAGSARSPDEVVAWNRTLLGILRTPGAQPATVHPTRSLALMHAAIHDAVVAIDRSAPPYLVRVRAPFFASRQAAADAAAHDTLVRLYPALTPMLDERYAGLLARVPNGFRKRLGLRVGQFVAKRAVAERADDGSAVQPPPYSAPATPGIYQPTPPAFAAPVFTHWSQVRPFVLRRGDQFRPPPPPALTNAEYAASFDEVKALGAVDSQTRTADQTQIARFWPAPIQNYWNEIAQTATLARGASLSRAARVFAQLDVAFADAAIAFYDAKYAHRLWRPITAIRTVDPSWTPLLNTPPDPSYPGAHSVIAAAGVEILAAAYGDRLRFAVTSEVLPGVARSFDSFSAAAAEAGASRTYAGVHFGIDDVSGQQLGRRVARAVLHR